MRRKVEDYIGKKIHHLTVLEDLGTFKEGSKKYCHYILVQCDCENKTIKKIRFQSLFHSMSCGCYHRKDLSMRFRVHGCSYSKEYRTWTQIKRRCLNPNVSGYYLYGGRGISICEEWENFEVFLRDMGKAPSKKHSIDRIDNGKGYFPENCRWATPKMQANNRRTNRNITYQNKTQTLTQWAEELNICDTALYCRLKRGWSLERALTTKREIKKISFNGETHSITEWAKILNVTRHVLEGKIKRGWPNN